MLYYAGVLVLMAAAYAGRFWLKDRAPELQQKAGESRAEARLILLGTYRVYSWTLALFLVQLSASAILGDRTPGWLPLTEAVFAITLLLLIRALYRRLGYGAEYLLFILGHLSVVFALSECIWALRLEVLQVTGTSTAGLTR